MEKEKLLERVIEVAKNLGKLGLMHSQDLAQGQNPWGVNVAINRAAGELEVLKKELLSDEEKKEKTNMELTAEHQYMAFAPVKEESLERLQVAFHGAMSIVEMREPTLAGKIRLDTTSEAVRLYSDEKDWFNAEALFVAIGEVLNEVTTVTKLFKITEGEFLFNRSGAKYRIYGEETLIELRKCEETVINHMQWGN